MMDWGDYEPSPFLQAYLQEHAARIHLQHLETVDELVAAFLVRHRCDPSDAVVVTTQEAKEGCIEIRTCIERRKHGADRAMS